MLMETKPTKRAPRFIVGKGKTEKEALAKLKAAATKELLSVREVKGGLLIDPIIVSACGCGCGCSGGNGGGGGGGS